MAVSVGDKEQHPPLKGCCFKRRRKGHEVRGFRPILLTEYGQDLSEPRRSGFEIFGGHPTNDSAFQEINLDYSSRRRGGFTKNIHRMVANYERQTACH